MRVEVPFRMIWARMICARMIHTIAGRLMEAHRVREGNAEHFIVRGSNALQNLAQGASVVAREFVHASEMPAAANQNFKRPDCPEGHERHEPVILTNHAHLLPLLQG